MRCLVLILLLLALPLSWGWAGPAQGAHCAGALDMSTMGGAELAGAHSAGQGTEAHHSTGTPPAPCAPGCGDEGSPCAMDCPCQGHSPLPGALHGLPATLHAMPADRGATELTRTVPEPYAATPLRPPSARIA